MLVRFYLDEDLPPRIAAILRAQGYDAISSHECGRNSLSDAERLRLAASEGRCFVTRNRDDFQVLNALFLENQWRHAGILVVTKSLPSEAFSRVARALIAYTRDHPGDLPSYMLDFLHSAD